MIVVVSDPHHPSASTRVLDKVTDGTDGLRNTGRHLVVQMIFAVTLVPPGDVRSPTQNHQHVANVPKVGRITQCQASSNLCVHGFQCGRTIPLCVAGDLLGPQQSISQVWQELD